MQGIPLLLISTSARQSEEIVAPQKIAEEITVRDCCLSHRNQSFHYLHCGIGLRASKRIFFFKEYNVKLAAEVLEKFTSYLSGYTMLSFLFSLAFAISLPEMLCSRACNHSKITRTQPRTLLCDPPQTAAHQLLQHPTGEQTSTTQNLAVCTPVDLGLPAPLRGVSELLLILDFFGPG